MSNGADRSRKIRTENRLWIHKYGKIIGNLIRVALVA